MSNLPAYDRNNAAFQAMKRTIAESYPHGWFVAIADSQVTATTFRELSALCGPRVLIPKPS